MTTFQTIDHETLETIAGGSAVDPHHKPDRSPRPGPHQELGYRYGSSMGAAFGAVTGGVGGVLLMSPVGGAVGAKLGKGIDNLLRR